MFKKWLKKDKKEKMHKCVLENENIKEAKIKILSDSAIHIRNHSKEWTQLFLLAMVSFYKERLLP